MSIVYGKKVISQEIKSMMTDVLKDVPNIKLKCIETVSERYRTILYKSRSLYIFTFNIYQTFWNAQTYTITIYIELDDSQEHVANVYADSTFDFPYINTEIEKNVKRDLIKRLKNSYYSEPESHVDQDASDIDNILDILKAHNERFNTINNTLYNINLKIKALENQLKE